MPTIDPDSHVSESIEAYLAGGLSPEEAAAFDTHVAACQGCATAVAQVARDDAELRAIFAAGRPDEGFEGRLVDRWRAAAGARALSKRPSRPAIARGQAVRVAGSIRHPMVRLAASGVAAAIVLGALGLGASQGMRDRALPLMENGPRLADGRWTWGAWGAISRESGRMATQARHATGGAVLALDYADTERTPAPSGASPDLTQTLSTPAELGRLTTEKVVSTVTSSRTDGSPVVVNGPDSLSATDASHATRAQSGNKQAPDFVDSYQRTSGDAQQGQRQGDQIGTVTAAGLYFQSATSKEQDQAARGRESEISLSSVKDSDGPVNGPQAGAARGPVAANGTAAASGPQTAAGGAAGSGVGGGLGAGAGPGGEPAKAPLAVEKDLGAAPSFNIEAGAHGAGGLNGKSGLFAGVAGDAGKAIAGKEASPVAGTPALPQAMAFKPDDLLKQAGRTDGKAPGAVSGEKEGVKLHEAAAEWSGVGSAAEPLASGKGAGGDQSGTPGIAEEAELRQKQLPALDKLSSEDGRKDDARKEPGGGAAPSTGVPGSPAPGPTSATPAKTSPPEASPAPVPVPSPEPSPAPSPATVTPAPPAPQAGPVNPPADPVLARKIIRNGDMAFEVDSFDSAASQVAKIVTEERGFVSTTDSEKLPNGKVKGTIVVRCPPDNLDTLVLKLRGLGDLKSQKITAQDVTKQYTDTQSQLRAAEAMEARLLDIIKNGKGTVKDLVEAEKQLGVYRERLETLKGEIRYYDNLVSLCTLAVTLYERDVKSPTAAAEIETVQMGIQADDVEKARTDALKAIEAAKGKIIQAELKQQEAGQLSATVIADVPPDASGPLVDRLRQLGKVSRLDIDRRQETTGGTGPVVAGLKVQRKDTRLQLSLYNLANVDPRQTTTLSLAAPDVDKAYRAILDTVISAGGRVVSSKLNRPGPDQVTGTIGFQVASEKADLLAAAVRSNGDVMRMDVTQNADTQNVTETKRGFVVEIRALAAVMPRETTALQIAAPAVPEAFNKLLEAARAGGRVITSQLNEQDPNNVSAQLEFDVLRENWGKVEAALRDAGVVVSRTVARSTDADNTVDSKVRLSLTLIDAARLVPRETIDLRLATRAVPESFNHLLDLAREAGGRTIAVQLNQQDKANMSGSTTVYVPREAWPRMEAALKDVGVVVSRNVARAADGPMTVDTKIGLSVSVVDERSLAARETSAMTVLVPHVADRYARVLEALRVVDAQIQVSKLDEKGPNLFEGRLVFVIPREDRPAVEKSLFDKADVFNRTVQRSQDVQNTLDTKVQMDVTLRDAEAQPARDRYTMGVEVSDVSKAAGNIEAAVLAAGGRKVDATESSDKGKTVARIVVDVPLAVAGQVVDTIRGLGNVTMSQRARDEAVPEGTLSRARIEVTLGTPDTIRADQSLGGSIREGLSTSLAGLLLSLQYIIVGLCLVGPWVLVVWVAWRILRGRRRDRSISPPTEPPAGAVPMPA